MFKPTYLYVKTHNITGLKYFGKTTAKDPYKYNGSGVRWRRHLNKHGKDISTEILGYYIDEDECRNFAIQFGKENDIVNSKEWANLKEESLDGGFDYINNNKDIEYINTRKNNRKRLYEFNKQNNFSGQKRFGEQNYFFGIMTETNFKLNKSLQSVANEKSQTEQSRRKRIETLKNIKHQQGVKNSQFGTIWIYNPETKENKKIRKENIIPEGWVKGRKIK